jgi:DNA-binding NtrC family response regulator
MPERRGLVLDRGERIGAELLALELQGWSFQIVSTLEAARRAMAGALPRIGLIAFDSDAPWSVSDCESLLARHDVEWIALLDKGFEHARALPPAVLRSFHDFHSLPFDRDRLEIILGHAWGKASLSHHVDESAGETGSYGMTGHSPRMQELYRRIGKVVAVDAPVLIGGESGSGKELVARAIHQYSARANGPFIAMNCGAIAPSLIHSELFGHERGAFTGAVQRKIGNIEAANNGVLFLDEIGDLPLELQANLLRFLQEKMITRVGSTDRLRVNVRVIAATHVDLRQAVAEGRFREDLYYRLNVVQLKVPPLRERREDIPLLAQEVFKQHKGHKSPQLRGFSSEALGALMAHDWPGNVRELINRVQHAMVMSEGRLLSAADLGLPLPTEDTTPTLDELRTSLERDLIESSLKKYRNNVSATARQLGVSRVTLYRMIDRLKIVL